MTAKLLYSIYDKKLASESMTRTWSTKFQRVLSKLLRKLNE